MYTIGQFSVMTKIPTKTLRYYDEINLLKPAKKDSINNYRYYDENSLLLAQQILIYRNCELSIEKIKTILMETSKSNDLKEVLKSHVEELNKKIDEINKSQSVLQKIIYNLEKVKVSKVMIKEYAERKVISIREKGNHDSIGNIISRLYEIVQKEKLKVLDSHTIIWYEDNESIYDFLDMEIYIPVESKKNTSFDCFKSISFCKYCEIEHVGSIATLSSSYKEIYSFIENKNFKIAGPFEETYIANTKYYSPENLKIIIKVPVKESVWGAS